MRPASSPSSPTCRSSWVKTVKRTKTYSHIDPISAAPSKNAFLKTVVPFLRKKIK